MPNNQHDRDHTSKQKPYSSRTVPPSSIPDAPSSRNITKSSTKMVTMDIPRSTLPSQSSSSTPAAKHSWEQREQKTSKAVAIKDQLAKPKPKSAPLSTPNWLELEDDKFGYTLPTALPLNVEPRPKTTISKPVAKSAPREVKRSQPSRQAPRPVDIVPQVLPRRAVPSAIKPSGQSQIQPPTQPPTPALSHTDSGGLDGLTLEEIENYSKEVNENARIKFEEKRRIEEEEEKERKRRCDEKLKALELKAQASDESKKKPILPIEKNPILPVEKKQVKPRRHEKKFVQRKPIETSFLEQRPSATKVEQPHRPRGQSDSRGNHWKSRSREKSAGRGGNASRQTRHRQTPQNDMSTITSSDQPVSIKQRTKEHTPSITSSSPAKLSSPDDEFSRIRFGAVDPSESVSTSSITSSTSQPSPKLEKSVSETPSDVSSSKEPKTATKRKFVKKT
ncbi:hypothetical protein GEMRC1_006262 [Eukaryota sp. GEM-RC1]